MNTLFADTYYFIALLSKRDAEHQKAASFTKSTTDRIVTTAWVMTEVADAFCKLAGREIFCRFFDENQQFGYINIEPLTYQQFEDGLALYKSRSDKEWSLTDCISFCVMKQHGITEALTGDHHFEQAGFVALLK